MVEKLVDNQWILSVYRTKRNNDELYDKNVQIDFLRRRTVYSHRVSRRDRISTVEMKIQPVANRVNRKIIELRPGMTREF